MKYKLNPNTANYLEVSSHKPVIINEAQKAKLRSAAKASALWGTASLSVLSAIILGLTVLALKAQDFYEKNEVAIDLFPFNMEFSTNRVVEVTPREEESLAVNTQPVAITQPVKSDMEVIEQYKLAPYLKGIYFLESTSGKNDWCRDNGEFNGYGFRQNSAEKKCYKDFEAVTEDVNDWLENRLSKNGNDIVEAVCLYNTGVAGKSWCEYSQNFVSYVTKNLLAHK